MKTVETIGVGTREDFDEVLALVNREWMDLEVRDKYYEDYDPTPWNLVVKGEEDDILYLLSGLDRRRIYYETTMRLPVL